MVNNTVRLTKGQASIKEWRKTADQLVQQVAGWIKHIQDWQMELFHDEIREEDLGTYSVPVLEIKTPDGELTLEPVPRRGPNDPIRAYLRAWPTLTRVRLSYRPEQDTWDVSSANVHVHINWDQEGFLGLTKDLLDVR